MEDVESLEYWIENMAFGIDSYYMGTPDYIRAQKYWCDIKNKLLDTYKDNVEVIRFINNLVVLELDNVDYTFTVSLILKYGIDHVLPSQYSHLFVCLIYEPFGEIRKQIKVYDYEWWEEDCYKLEVNDMENDMNGKLYQGFQNIMGWTEIKQEDLSFIFTTLFEVFSDRMEIKF